MQLSVILRASAFWGFLFLCKGYIQYILVTTPTRQRCVTAYTPGQLSWLHPMNSLHPEWRPTKYNGPRLSTRWAPAIHSSNSELHTGMNPRSILHFASQSWTIFSVSHHISISISSCPFGELDWWILKWRTEHKWTILFFITLTHIQNIQVLFRMPQTLDRFST